MGIISIAWIQELLMGTGAAHSLFVLSVVVTAGLLLAKAKVGGVSLGVTWILFVGIVAGQLGCSLDDVTSRFVKEFGLMIFVFSIGMEVGPGFFSSFRKGGLTLNLLAVLIIVLGCLVTLAIHWLTGESLISLIGVMSGAVTSTPAMGAAQQTYGDMTGMTEPSIAQGYAVAYPLSVVGTILCMILLKMVLRIDYQREEQLAQEHNRASEETLEVATLEVTNEAVCGKHLDEIQRLFGRKCVATRILHRASHDVELVNSETRLQKGDRLFMVATPSELEALVLLIGPRITAMDEPAWDAMEQNQLVSEKFVITNPSFNGRRLGDLRLRQTFNVTITRIRRAGVELIATSHLLLQLGDTVTVVGNKKSIDKLSSMMGNSVKKLNEPNLFVYFLGMALGVLLGSLPLFIPGMPVAFRLGLAGGPLIVAILMGKFGPQLKLVTYTTTSANHMLRQVGLTLFLAAVGLSAGHGFLETVADGGYWWILFGFIITVVPCLVAGFVARFCCHLNYFSIAGLLAGAMTDAPAMAYSYEASDNNQVPVAYSTVYPLTTFLRVIAAQLMVLLCL